ncbi:uncharacterized protein LOC132554918 [Ylistrum balloti]|uniref:uncharacterized protein LOC132554918 n=1 Tax=Ylistrum balloti TaxID=509963 RepID=UPI002905A955|nr:uncharacterized protein LOC132554918 [Ylistrum balloti]
MSRSKFGSHNCSLKQHPWIVNCICSPTRKQKSQTIDVIRDIEILGDGSVVRDVADREVIIRAVFSADAVQKFRQELEDSNSCPVEWNQALLLVCKYHTEFRPHKNLAKCEFVLHIDNFRLWDLQEGFQRKHRLIHCDQDARIQRKMKDLWEEKQIEWQREEVLRNTMPITSDLSQQNESMSSISVTQLLEEIAKDVNDTPKDVTPKKKTKKRTMEGSKNMATGQSTKRVTDSLHIQDEKVWQGKKKDLAEMDEDTVMHGSREKTTRKTTWKQMVYNKELSITEDLRRPFIVRDFLIPEHEQVILQDIAEWKEGYMPEIGVTASSEETGSSDKTVSYVTHTLVDDVSSMETLCQPSSLKKGRKDVTPEERTDNHSLQMPVNQESQHFVPCLSPENGSIVDFNRKRITSIADAVSPTRCKAYLEALEREEDERLEKLATPSKSFSQCRVSLPETTLYRQMSSLKDLDVLQTNCNGYQTEDQLLSVKHQDVSNKVTKDETPSSQTDSEPDSQLTKRRLFFSGAKRKRGRSSLERSEDTALISKDISGQPNLGDESIEILNNSPESAIIGKDRSAIKETISRSADEDHCMTGEAQSVMDSFNEAIIINSSHDSTSSEVSQSVLKYKNRIEDQNDLSEDESLQSASQSQNLSLQVQPSQSQNLSLQVQPSQSQNLSLQVQPSQSQNLSLQVQPSQSQNMSLQVQPSQSQNLSLQVQPSQSQNVSFPTDKSKLLASLTDIPARTETGRKLLELKFCDRLLNQIADYYSQK